LKADKHKISTVEWPWFNLRSRFKSVPYHLCYIKAL